MQTAFSHPNVLHVYLIYNNLVIKKKKPLFFLPRSSYTSFYYHYLFIIIRFRRQQKLLSFLCYVYPNFFQQVYILKKLEIM